MNKQSAKKMLSCLLRLRYVTLARVRILRRRIRNNRKKKYKNHSSVRGKPIT